MTTADHLSLITTPITLMNASKPVSQGTGFVYSFMTGEKSGYTCLVTNIHVLTGHDPLSELDPIGTHVEFYLHHNNQRPAEVREVNWPLFFEDGEPIWLRSNRYPEADVAFIPIPSAVFGKDSEIFCVSSNWAKSNLRLRPGNPVTAVGYPHSYYDQSNQLPIYKTGALASEPDFHFDGKPVILVDLNAFPGMSGSPVFAIKYGGYEKEEGGWMVGGVRKFIGIFASTAMLEEELPVERLDVENKSIIQLRTSLNLGHVWKAHILEDIITDIDFEDYYRKFWSRMNRDSE